MEIIGESMNIMNPTFFKALENKEHTILRSLAKRLKEQGVTALDINLGQSKKLSNLTSWLIELVQKETDLPLFLSSHVLSQPDVLYSHKGTPVINAVTANPDGLTEAMHIAKRADADLVVLLVSPELTPGDVNGRLLLANQVIDAAQHVNLPLSSLYLDPVISCRPDPTTWSLGGGLPDMDIIYESIKLLKEMSGEWKTIVALSNTSVYLPAGKRSRLHCRLFPVLAEAGLDAAILNGLDKKLMQLASAVNTRPQQPQELLRHQNIKMSVMSG